MEDLALVEFSVAIISTHYHYHHPHHHHHYIVIIIIIIIKGVMPTLSLAAVGLASLVTAILVAIPRDAPLFGEGIRRHHRRT